MLPDWNMDMEQLQLCEKQASSRCVFFHCDPSQNDALLKSQCMGFNFSRGEIDSCYFISGDGAPLVPKKREGKKVKITSALGHKIEVK